jgi:hypothetical protein
MRRARGKIAIARALHTAAGLRRRVRAIGDRGRRDGTACEGYCGAPRAVHSPPMTEREPLATVAELEEGLRQLHRMEMQTKLALEQLEARLAATIKVLHRADVLHVEAVDAETETQRAHVEQAHEHDVRIVLGPGIDKHTVEVPAIDCASLVHLCKARCCRFTVALDPQDLDDGLRWEYMRPYELRRRADGYCVYSEARTFRCDVYTKRPSICRSYDCRSDARVWESFADKKPAPWRDDVDVPPPLVQIRVPGRR